MTSGDKYITTAFQLNIAAALATVVGGLVICSPRTLRLATPMALSTTLSISGGVTVFMSLVLLFGFSVLEFNQAFQNDVSSSDVLDGQTWVAATLCLGVGIMIVYLVDLVVQKLTPGVDPETPKQLANNSELQGSLRGSIQDSVLLESPRDQGFVKMDEAAKEKLQRMGILSGIAIALHNIPSGMATFTAGLDDPAFGLPMAIGVGLHNMAEGVAVAAPVYFATGSKWKGIMWCIIAAVAEHVGAFIAFGVVGKDVGAFDQAALYGVVAGMMSTITMKEIFPTAYTYANGRIHLVSNGGLAGMILMALSLSFFKHVGVSSSRACSSPAKAPPVPPTGMRSPTKIRTPTKLVRPRETHWASRAKDVKKRLLEAADGPASSSLPPPKRIRLSSTQPSTQQETASPTKEVPSAADVVVAVPEPREDEGYAVYAEGLQRQVEVAQP
ncbi:hypothetical protein ON010_g9213 [Phytophthora cinnamomi]|nr:hypothetical protein ON010_g9213 [Phytophthora cinnamomi]